MLDCDGVLTGLDEQQLRFPENLDGLLDLLDKSAVSLCSGRSAAWIKREILDPLIARLNEKQKSIDLLQGLCIIAESGGVIIDIDKKGNIRNYKDTIHAVPTVMQEAIRRLVALKYSREIQYDEEKESIATVFRRPEVSQKEFEEARERFLADVAVLTREYTENGNYTIDSTAIAVDFKHKDVNKTKAAQIFIDFLRKRGITAKSFEVVGDSSSDPLMAQGLYLEGKSVLYNHVGIKPIENAGQYQFPVINRIRTNDDVMRDYFREQNARLV